MTAVATVALTSSKTDTVAHSRNDRMRLSGGIGLLVIA
jgi:hypothetical protein